MKNTKPNLLNHTLVKTTEGTLLKSERFEEKSKIPASIFRSYAPTFTTVSRAGGHW